MADRRADLHRAVIGSKAGGLVWKTECRHWPCGNSSAPHGHQLDRPGSLAAALVVAAFCGGRYSVTERAALRVTGIEHAAFMAQIAAVNSILALRDYCYGHATQGYAIHGDAGWVRCASPAV